MADKVIKTDLSSNENGPRADSVHSWVKAYFEGTRSGDPVKWASAFADNALVDDPVGTPAKDTPEAIRKMGEEFLGAFKTVGLYESFVHVVGNEAVARWRGEGTTLDGQDLSFEGINVFEFDDAGKIRHLRGFFQPPGH